MPTPDELEGMHQISCSAEERKALDDCIAELKRLSSMSDEELKAHSPLSYEISKAIREVAQPLLKKYVAKNKERLETENKMFGLD